MTEATCAVTGWDAITAPVPSSVGELNANCSAKIMTEDGTAELPVGQRGELWVQGPKLVILYFPSLVILEEMLTKKQRYERLLAQRTRNPRSDHRGS
jgi:4-coumarate--CoA ligase